MITTFKCLGYHNQIRMCAMSAAAWPPQEAQHLPWTQVHEHATPEDNHKPQQNKHRDNYSFIIDPLWKTVFAR